VIRVYSRFLPNFPIVDIAAEVIFILHHFVEPPAPFLFQQRLEKIFFMWDLFRSEFVKVLKDAVGLDWGHLSIKPLIVNLSFSGI
jgi:hypothetical protein